FRRTAAPAIRGTAASHPRLPAQLPPAPTPRIRGLPPGPKGSESRGRGGPPRRAPWWGPFPDGGRSSSATGGPRRGIIPGERGRRGEIYAGGGAAARATIDLRVIGIMYVRAFSRKNPDAGARRRTHVAFVDGPHWIAHREPRRHAYRHNPENRGKHSHSAQD